MPHVIGSAGGYTRQERYKHAQDRSVPYRGRAGAAGTILLALPCDPYVQAGRRRKLGLRRTGSTQPPDLHRPPDSCDGGGRRHRKTSRRSHRNPGRARDRNSRVLEPRLRHLRQRSVRGHLRPAGAAGAVGPIFGALRRIPRAGVATRRPQGYRPRSPCPTAASPSVFMRTKSLRTGWRVRAGDQYVRQTKRASRAAEGTCARRTPSAQALNGLGL